MQQATLGVPPTVEATPAVLTPGDTSSTMGVSGELVSLFRGMLDAQVQQSAAVQVGIAAMVAQAGLSRDAPVSFLAEFRAMKPPEFFGTGTPLDASIWFERIERLLEASTIPVERRVSVVQI